MREWTFQARRQLRTGTILNKHLCQPNICQSQSSKSRPMTFRPILIGVWIWRVRVCAGSKALPRFFTYTMNLITSRAAFSLITYNLMLLPVHIFHCLLVKVLGPYYRWAKRILVTASLSLTMTLYFTTEAANSIHFAKV